MSMTSISVNPWVSGTFSTIPRFVVESTIPVVAAGVLQIFVQLEPL